MNSDLLRQVDVAMYLRMVERAAEGVLAVGIVDGGRVCVQGEHADTEAILLRAAEDFSCGDPERALSVVGPQRKAHGGGEALAINLCDANGQTAGALVLVCRGDLNDKVCENVESIVQCLTNELALTAELDSMTAELTERYEELNLVYHTEDQVSYFREGRDALTQLVENCNNYLGVGLTALVLKSKKIEIVQNSTDNPLEQPKLVLARLQEELYDWIETNNSTVVINDLADDLAIRLLRGLPYKILCTPVLDGSGTVAGLLVIVNAYSKSDFTNGDKNLLAVMARKAGKIIQANYDALTGLVNRGGFEYFLEAAVEQLRGTSKQHCVLHLNVDQLTVINDTAGHHAGDEVIRQIVRTATAHLRETDTMARVDGDRFGILLKSCTCRHGEKVAEQIRRSVEALEVTFNERHLKTTVSLGVATLSAETPDLESVLAGAEIACGGSSEKGGNRVEVYHDENSELVQRRRQMQLVEKIQKSISEDRFALYCQVIEPIQNPGDPRHFEILLRMMDGDDVVSPGLFIPAAERYHLMPAVDRWVVHKSLEAIGELPPEAVRECIFAINLSGQSLGDPAFLEFLAPRLEQSPVPKQCICFEITETAAIDNLAAAQHFITTLASQGCQFSLDDFGVGLSSFSYLKSLPVDQLKIDGEFVKDLLDDQVSAAMVAAINEIGHTMGLKTIAEFVENDGIRARLVDMGVDYAQGYGIGKPIPLAEQLEHLKPASAAAGL